jgi:hypothetical protein
MLIWLSRALRGSQAAEMRSARAVSPQEHKSEQNYTGYNRGAGRNSVSTFLSAGYERAGDGRLGGDAGLGIVALACKRAVMGRLRSLRCPGPLKSISRRVASKPALSVPKSAGRRGRYKSRPSLCGLFLRAAFVAAARFLGEYLFSEKEECVSMTPILPSNEVNLEL